MTETAVDYAWQHPDPQAIADAGVHTVLRYLSQDPSKDITADEAANLHAKGINVGLIWETTAQRADESNPAQNGVADGLAAAAQAATLGYPQGAVIFANIGDWATTAEELPAVRQYAGAFRTEVESHGYTAGGYCSSYVIGALANALTYWWQNAIDAGGVSGSEVNAHADLYQRVSPTVTIEGAAGSYDEDVVLHPLPLWGPATIPTPAPKPPPPAHPAFPGRLLSLGVSGADVSTWQEQMSDRGWTITVDGVYGPQSKGVCEAFQREKGLTVDGIVGPQTWDAAWTAPVTRP